ncbi:hypothetical protein CLV33_102319 [Jejuia pallidilutea]|uniref:Flavin mononucleotide-binding protein n=1 Tax=Jejuia pallidilutea TaxID=504487 RepID=A0A362X3D3_9FLAO|nr:pyridoxamine 5'-phosphate oxidase family protein [Jejuia pallidilutea]PQV50457.1 hypothetical protein CLV33_102319 [Jejuia pallidilutea]
MIRNLNKQECLLILNTNYIAHLAYLFGECPIIIPITYYYNEADDFIICYSACGQKINSMRKHNYVSLSVDEIESVNKWKCVLVEGTFKELKGPDAKYYLHEFAKGVKHIMANKEQKEANFISEFSSKLESEGTPIVFKIDILEVTGKQR